jgi:class 3 adenylate cyclase
VRAGSSQLRSRLPEGRFDESSQKDVLALAARLQREHFETMSASEIEQAAAEAGLDPGFVREAIKRIGETPIVEEAAEPQSATKSEWIVGIAVPVVVFLVFAMRHFGPYEPGSFRPIVLMLIVLPIMLAILGLAAVGVKTLLGSPVSLPVLPGSAKKNALIGQPISAASVAVTGLMALSLLSLCMRSSYAPYNFFPNGALLFTMILTPFFGAVQKNVRAAFWRGGAVGCIAGAGIWAINWFRFEPRTTFDAFPAMLGFGLIVFGIASLTGFGVKSLFVKTPKVDHDRTEMLRQLFELQTALDAHRESRTFLSIDVVGSTAMKAGATELEAEFSFLQYQAWVADTVRLYGGEVQHVAGDGAMAMFRDPSGALGAARMLQLGIQEFNSTRNRMGMPFAIRCGVAEGRVGLDSRSPLGMVQSPVVDRAAMLQKSAASGSIMVTQEMVSVAMPVLESLHRSVAMDGSSTYSWP